MSEKKSNQLAVVSDQPAALALADIPAQVRDDFAPAQASLRMAKMAAAQSMGFFLLSGQYLLGLHKKYGVKRGGDRRSKDQTQAQLGLIWEDLVKELLGISDEWASKLMHGAETSKKLLPGVAEILALPMEQWTDERIDDLNTAIQKTSDAETFTGLLTELKVLKAPPTGESNNPQGRSKGTKDKRTLEQKAEDAVWPVQDTLGTFLESTDHAAFVRVLPIVTEEGKRANLKGLEDLLSDLLSLVKTAIRERGRTKKVKAKKPTKKAA